MKQNHYYPSKYVRGITKKNDIMGRPIALVALDCGHVRRVMSPGRNLMDGKQQKMCCFDCPRRDGK